MPTAGNDLDDSQRLLFPTQTQSQDEDEDDDLLADSFYIKAMRLCHEKDNTNLDVDCPTWRVTTPGCTKDSLCTRKN